VTLRTPEVLRRPRGRKHRRRTEFGLMIGAAVIISASYVLMVLGNTGTPPSDAAPLLVIMLLMAMGAHVANRFFAPDAHPVILPIAFLLNGLGYVMIARIDLGLATSYAPLQAAWTAGGVGAYVLTLFIIRRTRDLDRYRYLLLIAGVVLLLLPLMPKLGATINGARLWIHVGSFEFQPVELAKIVLCIFFASYFADKREVLTIPTARIGNRLVVDPRPLFPIALAWVFAIGVMSLEDDIGFSALLFTLFIGLLWVTTGRSGYLLLGVGLFAVGVETWLDPWKTASTTGNQLANAWWAMGTGGIGGTGLGLGRPEFIPDVKSDFIFAAFGEEMGLFGGTMIIVAFMLLVGAGLRVAQAARSEFAKLTATGLTIILGFQAFFIIAGVTRLLPFTGITLPFVAYGGSALIANYVLIALLMRISDEGNAALDAKERAEDQARAGAPV
jgi:cell division protein FtsW (lipid II flippase)